MAAKKDPRLAKAGVDGYNKPKRTPNHPTKSHVLANKGRIPQGSPRKVNQKR